MSTYEVWRKGKSKCNTRKYVVVAEDTDSARFQVATHVLDEEGENLGSEKWDVGYPNEDDLRQRRTHGHWYRGSVWDMCHYNETQNKIGVVFTYIC